MKASGQHLMVHLPFVERCSLKGVIHSLDLMHDNRSKTKAELIPQQRVTRNI